jgi:hypothetical protein
MSKKKNTGAAGQEGTSGPPPEDLQAAAEDAGEVQPDEVLPSLGELAEAVASGEAVPGGELTEQEIAQLKPGDVAELSVAPEGQAPAAPPEESIEEVPRETEEPFKVYRPLDTLREIVQGTIKPEDVGVSVVGAGVSFCFREKKWRDAIALRIAGIREGVVSIDLETDDRQAILDVPCGDKIRCWKFHAE